MTTKSHKNLEEKTTPKSVAGGDSKSQDLDIIRKNLAKRSLHVKFDLDDTGYQPIEKIGIGAYGVVCSAIHKESSDRVAIKKIPYVFEALAIAKRTYREIKILKHFKHDNIISIREILKPKESFQNFKDIYVVFDLMESDLHRIIYSEQPLTEEHIRYFLYQILRGLKYIHSANVVHRDLKPSNLLVNEDCHVRIGDFGMARGVNCQPEEPSHYMTQYVATRWYRAPEILLSLLEYGTAVDMWSVGCIFAEMLGRKHLFPGKDYLTQVKLVLGLLGTPSESVLKNCQNDVLRRIIRSLDHRKPMPWTTLFPKGSKKALDLLGKMLVINPADRITVERALKHPFLSKYHDPDDEPICVPSFEFDFEKELLHMDSEQLRDVIYKEIMEFHQPRTPTLSFLACLRPAPKTEEALEERGEGGGGGGVMSASLKDQLQAVMSSMSARAEGKGEATGVRTSGAFAQEVHANSAKPPLAPDIPQATQTLEQIVAAQPPSPEDGEVFKKPPEKAATKKSPVSVETTNLQLPSCLSDVEMLSAQSTDGSKAMDTQTPRPPGGEKQERDKETKPAEKKGPENKTISEDTKALVKQALLSHRHRTESCGDEDKPRPVTAAQRQREREEKRKKKRDSKMKKMQEKKKEVPQRVELSDADKELLARWSSMQKKETWAAATPQTTSASQSTPPLPTIVYLQQANPATPSPPQGPPGLSPPHPAPTSTPPSVLPAGLVGGLVAGQMAVGPGQVMVPHASLPQTVGLPGGHLQITQTQAEALKEALQLSQGAIVSAERRQSGEGGGVCGDAAALPDTRPVHTPPQGAASHDAATRLSPPALPPDPSRSPHHNSASPSSLHQHASSHSPHTFTPPDSCPPSDMLFSKTLAGQTNFTHTNFPQGTNNVGADSDQLPQNLAEFLERHCQKPDPGNSLAGRSGGGASETFPSGNFQTSDIKMNAFGDSPAVSHQAAVNSGMEKLKSEEPGFAPCQYFPTVVKPDTEFSDKTLVTQPLQDTSHLKTHMNPSPAACSFQNTAFSVSSSSGSLCYSGQTPSVAGTVPPPPSYFLPSNTAGVPFGGHSVQGGAQGLPFSSQGSVDSSSHITVPFSRYSDTAIDFHMLGSRDVGNVQGAFGVGSHTALSHGAMGPHPGLTQVTVGSHPGLGHVSVGPHPSLAPASVSPHQNPVPPQGVMAPPDSFPPQQHPSFLPMQTSASASHPAVHHAHLPQHLHHHLPATHHPDPTTATPSHPVTGSQGRRRGPDLRVSAPKPEGVDMVAVLSSKLSSIFPPSLSLTPKGTGAGYGVGMDMDVLMADAADNAGRGAELSPLSSSLLADWLDLSGNISQADLDALAQDFGMTSPMAMSYTDFHSSGNNNNTWG
ncbi:uncharacterized protein LOC143288364 [Babylonia areolata]|uniref:uncharacterized protein LOC143288364 n=1 Tax=Babylonia areolata TaxID=304850 RepID=UPI003FD61C92